jgi:hypothetical protein
MKKSIRFYTIFTFLTLCGLLSASLTRAQGYSVPDQAGVDAYPASYPWAYQYIQRELNPPRDVGGFVSLALMPFNNYLVASYYDATHQTLMIASPLPNHAGNCGTNHNWVCVTLDGGGDAVGKFSSIDMWGYSVNNWKMGISYYDETNRALKAAIYSCYFGTCGWKIAPVILPEVHEDAVGLYSSFKFNATGNASIASVYFDATYNENTMLYAYQVSDGGNCGIGLFAGLWECEDVFYIGDSVTYLSLDFAYNGKANIAYYESDDGNLRLSIQGDLCGPEIGWGCITIDSGGDVGLYPSLIAPDTSEEPIRIAYLDRTNGHLKYYDSDWGNPLIVDEMGTSADPKGISLKLDKDGYPIIAYQSFDSEFSPAELRLARPNDVYGEELYGNCGNSPPGYLFQYWRCLTLDHGGHYTDEANFGSLVVNSHGLIGIAYTEYDWGLDVTSLKFTNQTYLKNFLPMAVK